VGTLAEILLTWNLLMGKGHPPAPLVLLGTPWKGGLEAHRGPGLVLPELFDYVQLADTPEQAVRLALDGAVPRNA
jgi:predicted Rossmann-fold nucleotide-binding protein